MNWCLAIPLVALFAIIAALIFHRKLYTYYQQRQEAQNDVEILNVKRKLEIAEGELKQVRGKTQPRSEFNLIY